MLVEALLYKSNSNVNSSLCWLGFKMCSSANDEINSKIKFFMLMMMMESDKIAAAASKLLMDQCFTASTMRAEKKTLLIQCYLPLIFEKHLMTNVIKTFNLWRRSFCSLAFLNLKTLAVDEWKAV